MSTISISQWPKCRNSGILRPIMGQEETDLPDIGRRLRHLRKALGLSQVVVAGLMQGGMTSQKWNNYERARDKMPVDVAINLCIISGADLDYIFRGTKGGLPSDLLTKIQKAEAAEAAPTPTQAAVRS